MTQPTYKSLSRQLLRYRRAAEHLSWIGGEHPEYHQAIEGEFIKAEESILKAFRKLTQKGNN